MARNDDVLLIDDFARDDLISALGTPWRGFSDRVMGGISQETIALTEINGRRCIRLTGDVRLENNGGFIQIALDLAPEGQTLDASAYDGVLLVARGNGESYGVHLRTPDCIRRGNPIGRASSPRRVAGDHAALRSVRAASADRHRRTSGLRRLGLVAIGRAFDADLAVRTVCLYGSRYSRP